MCIKDRKRINSFIEGVARLFDSAGVISNRKKREIRQRIRQRVDKNNQTDWEKIGQDFKKVL